MKKDISCKHPKHGPTIRKNCPKTCGLCNERLRQDANQFKSNSCPKYFLEKPFYMDESARWSITEKMIKKAADRVSSTMLWRLQMKSRSCKPTTSFGEADIVFIPVFGLSGMGLSAEFCNDLLKVG